MKYIKVSLDLNYEKYSEQETNNLNSYTKNRVYFSQGKYHIYVDNGKEKEAIQKIRRHLETKFEILKGLITFPQNLKA